MLLLGSSYDEVALLHYAEHVASIPDRRMVRFQVPLLVNGQPVWRARRPAPSGKMCPRAPPVVAAPAYGLGPALVGAGRR